MTAGTRRADAANPEVTPYLGRRIAMRPVTVAPAVAVTAPLPILLDVVDSSDRPAPAVTAAGKRRAVRHAAGRRNPLLKGVPSAPVLLGIATLAVAVGGAVSSAGGPDLASNVPAQLSAASALSGASGTGSVSTLEREVTVSRDSRQQALAESTDPELVEAAEAQAKQRNAALAQFAEQAQVQADKIALNQWVMPLTPVVLTARYGEYGLWASYHTGLDFNGNTGDPIMSVANGVVTFVGYDGSYGNKTVVTLEDGTEIWYAHQTTQSVSVGEVVQAGEVIGTVGATGNVTGSHLHLEVRPGGGDPVDPYQAMLVHGAVF
ncbi:hypothetical protein NPS01_03360 [Nocardioides psychrotolerans]|nr:hypothetical protein NPS01_03360 [Nocardioides psychrotolerans]